MLGWRPIDAASSLDLATSQDRQSAANMKRRRTLRNYTGNRRMIDTAYDLATWQPSACRCDRFSDSVPVALRIGFVHAIKGDQVALVVAHSHVYNNVELPCLCDGSGNYCIRFGQSYGHGTNLSLRFSLISIGTDNAGLMRMCSRELRASPRRGMGFGASYS
jgi:hypothetical protein